MINRIWAREKVCRVKELLHDEDRVCIAPPEYEVQQSVSPSFPAPWNWLSQGGWGLFRFRLVFFPLIREGRGMLPFPLEGLRGLLGPNPVHTMGIGQGTPWMSCQLIAAEDCNTPIIGAHLPVSSLQNVPLQRYSAQPPSDTEKVYQPQQPNNVQSLQHLGVNQTTVRAFAPRPAMPKTWLSCSSGGSHTANLPGRLLPWTTPEKETAQPLSRSLVLELPLCVEVSPKSWYFATYCTSSSSFPAREVTFHIPKARPRSQGSGHPCSPVLALFLPEARYTMRPTPFLSLVDSEPTSGRPHFFSAEPSWAPWEQKREDLPSFVQRWHSNHRYSLCLSSFLPHLGCVSFFCPPPSGPEISWQRSSKPRQSESPACDHYIVENRSL